MPQTNILAAPLSTKEKNALPNSSFAWIDSDGGRHLPYKDASGKVDLNHTRNALARLNQVNGMSDSERASVKKKLQSALANAKGADDIIMRSFNAIQADGTSTMPTRIELLREGSFNTEKYGNIPLSASDLEEMKSNFDNGVGMAHEGETGIPIDFSHESGKKAAGWVKDLQIDYDEDGMAHLMGSGLEWSTSGKEAIEGKEFKCLSSDFYPKAFGSWVDPESGVAAQNVIVGAALTNRPMFTGNQPLLASETDEAGGTLNIINIQATEKEQSMNLAEVRAMNASEVSGEQQRFLQSKYSELNADERTKFGLVEPKGSPVNNKNTKTIKASEITGTEGEVNVQAADIKSLVDDNKSLKASVEELQASDKAHKEKDAKSIVAEAIGKGQIVADQAEKWVGLILADAKNQEVLEALPVNKLVGTKQGGNASESADKTAHEQLVEKAKELMASDDKLGIESAMNKVSGDPKNKELVEKAAEENKILAGVA